MGGGGGGGGGGAGVHWRDFLGSLHARGLHGVKLVVSDAHARLKPALDARWVGVPWQRCQFHLMENAMAFVPKPGMRKAIVAGLRAVFDAPDRPEAGRQLGIAVKEVSRACPEADPWLEANVPEGLAVFALPASHWRRLRTIHTLERLNKELEERRTREWPGYFRTRRQALAPGQCRRHGSQRGLGDQPQVPESMEPE